MADYYTQTFFRFNCLIEEYLLLLELGSGPIDMSVAI
jgi:hypothetical protein